VSDVPSERPESTSLLGRVAAAGREASRKLNPGQFGQSGVGQHIAHSLDLLDTQRYLRSAGLSGQIRYALGLAPMSEANANRYRSQVLRRVAGTGGIATSSLNPGSLTWDEPSAPGGFRRPRQMGSRTRREALLGSQGDEDGDDD
jgi:hypothetical protein